MSSETFPRDALTRVEKEIQGMGGRVATLVMDVTKEQDNDALAQLAIDRFGAINLVVPCAGIIRDGLFCLRIEKPAKSKTKCRCSSSVPSLISI